MTKERLERYEDTYRLCQQTWSDPQNRCRCPLTGLAEELGAGNGSVTAIYLPKILATNLPWIHVPLVALALYLHARNLLQR